MGFTDSRDGLPRGNPHLPPNCRQSQIDDPDDVEREQRYQDFLDQHEAYEHDSAVDRLIDELIRRDPRPR